MFVHRIKLRPPQLLPMWIERPELERRLNGDVRVFCAVAGPGYGKTVLAARLFAAWDGPKLWYSLDESDADLAAFAGHLEALLVAAGGLGEFRGDPSHLASPKDVGRLFAEAIAEIATPPLVVFDDVHVLENSRALVALGEFIERGVRAGATFVVCGRTMPLSLGALAAAGQFVSVGAAELAFDDAEVRAFLAHVRPQRDDGAFDDLVRQAEGWPAGLTLVGSAQPLASRGRPGSPAAHDDRTRRLLFDYLANEVLAGLSERERDFLTVTSILTRLEVALCDRLRDASDSAEILAALGNRGLFIVRASDEEYLCHQLFRAFLQHRLTSTLAPDDIADLHRRVAERQLERGDTADAIAHRFAAGDTAEAAALFEETAIALLRHGLIATIVSLLERIDQARVESSPTLLLALGRVQRERGDWDAALATFERSIAVARTSAAYDALAEAVRSCATILASRGEFERLQSMLTAALALGDALSEESTTTLRMTLAAIFVETQRFEEALAIFGEITPSVTARGDYAAQGSVLHNTAVALLRRGDIYAGLAMYERALRLKRWSGQRASSLFTLGDLVYANVLLGNLDEAERLCDELLAEARDLANNAFVAHAMENRGTIRLARGDVAGAAAALAEAQRTCDPGDVLIMPDILHGLAQCALAAGSLNEADERCSAAIGIFRSANRHQQAAPIQLTKALVAERRGETDAAIALAREAVESAGRGADAVLQTIVCLDSAAALARLASGDGALGDIDRLAASAAATGVALLHQRDYRFLLRTHAATFEALRPHLLRWKIGTSLTAGAHPQLERGGSGAQGLRIELLGGLRVFRGGRPVASEAWKRRRARDILALLVSARGKTVPRSRLADLYWPDADADTAHRNLRVTITAIRNAVGDVIKYEADGYRFAQPPRATVDVEEFDEHIERARQAIARGDEDEARQNYGAATDQYRGEFLEAMDEGGWQWHERERLRAACLEALRWLAARQDGTPARLALERLLEIAPFDLDAVRMRLHRLANERRVAEARRDYAQWCARYRAAIGADPPELFPADMGSRSGTR